MHKRHSRLSIHSFGRGFGGHEEIMCGADVRTWEAACDHLATKVYSSPSGQVVVTVDWRTVLDEARELYRFSNTKDTASLMQMLQKDNLPLSINCTVSGPDEWRDLDSTSFADYIEHFVYETFLIVNLSSPGGFDLFTATLSVEGAKKPVHIGCSAFLFEDAWHRCLEEGWPAISECELKSVVRWFNSLNIGTRQLARSRMDKALFSLLHLSKSNFMDPLAVVWLVRALESLYDVPPSLSYTFICNRVAQVLDLPADKEKKLRKQLRILYDARNEFVHGGGPVAHPMSNEVWDFAVGIYRESLLDSAAFAAAIVLGTIQKHISNGWREIQFTETHSAIPLSAEV